MATSVKLVAGMLRRHRVAYQFLLNYVKALRCVDVRLLSCILPLLSSFGRQHLRPPRAKLVAMERQRSRSPRVTAASYTSVSELPRYDLVNGDEFRHLTGKEIKARWLMCPQCDRWTSCQFYEYTCIFPEHYPEGGIASSKTRFSYVHCRRCEGTPILCYGRHLQPCELPHSGTMFIFDGPHTAGFTCFVRSAGLQLA